MFTVAEHAILSDRVIPAESGEFYSYTSEFTTERPVFALMKCKANKNRPIEQLTDISFEASIFFQFCDSTQAKAHSIKAARALGFLGSYADEKTIGETWLALSEVTTEEFYEIHSHKDVEKLVKACREACFKRQVVVELNEGSIVTMTINNSKYGMFLVQEITSVSIRVAACHILL